MTTTESQDPIASPAKAVASATEEAVAAQIRRIATALEGAQRAQQAKGLLAALRAPEHAKPVLFIAGEDKRGKSCLVNALLSRPDLSPVGVEVVTAAPITFFYSSQPQARAYHYGQREPTPGEFQQVRALATVAGNPRNQRNISGISLGCDSELLKGVNLIDTPGVGGLESGHAALTLQSLQRADALIFVTEAGAQFRAAELSFLRRASARVDTVILVLTKTDVHRGWRSILDDDLTILREQAQRFEGAPFVPVSSLLALRALAIEDADPDEVAELRAESGIAKLEQLITEHVVNRATTLREVNLLRTGIGALGGAELGLRQTLAAVGVDDAPRKALEAERARLQGLQRDRSIWPAKLDGEIRKLTLERSEAASRGTVEIKRRFDERLRNVKKSEFDELPGELVADLTALAARLNETAATRLTALIEQQLDDIDQAAGLGESIRAMTGEAMMGELDTGSLGDYGMSFNDKLSVMSSFSSGRSLSSLAGIIAGSIIAPPVGIALGVALGGLFAFNSFLSRDQHAFQAAFNSWMSAQITHAQLSINNVFQRQMIDVQAQIRQAVQDALSQREREIGESLHAAEAVMRTETQRRDGAIGGVRDHVAAIRTLREQTIAQLAKLAAASPATVAAPAPPAAEPPAAEPGAEPDAEPPAAEPRAEAAERGG